MSDRWIDICALDDIPLLGSRVVRQPAIHIATEDIAVFRTAVDQVFALENRCPHKGGPLSEGIVHGTRITCPLHQWTLDLASGEAVAPDQGCARRHAVQVREGRVLLATGPLAGQ